MTPRHRHRLFLLTGAALAALTATPHAADAAGWTTGPPVSAPGAVAVTPLAGVSPSGERLVAWTRTTPPNFNHTGLAVRVAPPGGDFGDVQLINDTGVEDPSLTVGADGTAALVWFSDTSLHIATRAPGKPAFTEASPFPLGGFEQTPAKAVVVGGDVYVAATSRSFAGNVETTRVDVLRLSAGGSAIERLPGAVPGGALAQVSFNTSTQPGHTLVNAALAVSGGDIHVVWEEHQDVPGGSGVTKLMRATGSVAAGTFPAPLTADTLTEPSFFRAPTLEPLIGVGGGRVLLAYEAPGTKILYQDLTDGGGPRPATTDGGFNLRGGVDTTGALVLAYERVTAPDNVQGVFEVTVPPGGTPAPAVRLTPRNAARRIDDLVVGPGGETMVVPDRTNSFGLANGNVQVQAAFRAPGGDFGPLEEVSGARDRTGSSSEVEFDKASGAIGADGQAIIAWAANDRSGTRNERVFVSGRDATPPTISAVDVPPLAATGAVVRMSATAADTASPVTVSWDFGDGTQTTGPAVATAYTDPGTYTVTVTARDAAGNSATLTRTIVVAVPSRGTGGGDGPSAPDRTPPVITALKTSNARFRSGSGDTAGIAAKRKKAKKAPAGTVFSQRVSERATLVYAISGKVKGRKVDLPVFLRAARGPGAVSVPFSGRISGSALAPGSYTASVTAIDAAGNRSRPATVRFTVVSR